MEDKERQELIELYEEFAEDEANLRLSEHGYHIYMAAVDLLENTSASLEDVKSWVANGYAMGR
jgi:hypothetical protein